MTEHDDPQPDASGNRWEPTGETPETPVPPAAAPAPAPTAAPPSGPTWWTRTRAGVAGGAAAVLLVGGLGGFAVGRATAGPDDGPGIRQGGPAGFERDGDGFQGGPGGPMTGQFPDGGQLPGPPGSGQDGQQDGTDGSDT
jgi:hypothetical protein